MAAGRSPQGRPRQLALPRAPMVLLLVDVINPMDFEGAGALAEPALAAAQALAALKASLRPRRVPAIYVNDNFGEWQSDFAGLLRRCRTLKGSAAALARRLAPQAGDLTVLKPRHSGFHATPLQLLLHEMRTHTLIVTGLAADQCVQVTAADAYQRGFRLWVPPDCTAAETPARHRAAMEWMALHLKASVQTSERWLSRRRR